MYNFPIRLELACDHALRNRWIEGDLRRIWAEKHPDLFDEHDIPSNQPENYFYEWLTAIAFKEQFGLLSLVSKFGYHGKRKHPHKQEVLHRCFDDSACAFLTADPLKLFDGRHSTRGWPDLFVYTRDFKPAYFCEVKGEMTGDGPRPEQEAVFRELESRMAVPVVYAIVRGDHVRRRSASQS